jgi:hypothetical protein
MSEATTSSDQPEGKAPRDVSTVQFPYSDLDEALTIARTIHQEGGHPLSREQIAIRLNQKPTSGAFITKVSAGKMFGFLEAAPQNKLQITSLGYEALDGDESRARAARAEAFLNVELYRKLYDQFRSTHLPPRHLGLEQALVGFGVAPKQKTNARYAFDRSAKQAGYFDHGMDRLVEPVVSHRRRDSAGENRPPPSPPPTPPADKPPEAELDGVITALIEKLPTEGTWDVDERVAWLRMMAMAFDMAYGRMAAIKIEQPEAAKPPHAPQRPPPAQAPSAVSPAPLAATVGPRESFPAELDDEIPF